MRQAEYMVLPIGTEGVLSDIATATLRYEFLCSLVDKYGPPTANTEEHAAMHVAWALGGWARTGTHT